MWDDEINKKIKDAADQYHPAYDENAWDKMKLLLDQHLPVENKRKRKYFLIPLIALLLGGSFFIIYYMQTNSAPKNSQKTETKNNVSATKLPQQKSPATVVLSSSTTAKPKTTLNSVSPLTTKNFNNQLKNSNNKISVNKQGKTNTIVTQGAVEKVTDVQNNTAENSKTNQQQDIAKENTVSETATTIVNNPNPDIKEEIAKAKKDSANTKEVAKTKDAKESDAKKKSTKTSKSFRNNFAIDFSAGPDVSIVGLNNTGRIAINYGVGFSYALSGRFTLRTGFYISDKIYSANKDEYHVPSAGSANIAYLYNINANCKVYEIPVTVSYNFGKVKNHQWFASAGLSSYLMKKESYSYYYKYPNGYEDSKLWSISNQNQHYFSVLDLSAGYEYLFSKRTSLLAEPYLKMPLSGIGAGKVKLNSGGILFTFTLKPFYKK
jgi:hypothetical protein